MVKTWRRTGVLAVLIAVTYASFRAVPHDIRIGVMHEDGVGESIGAASLFLTAVLFFLAFRHLRRHPAPGASRLKPFIALGLSALFFLAAGEEVSWGQRILGFSTPEALIDANRQEETNLHNLTWSDFDEYRLFTLVWIPYALILPALPFLLPQLGKLLPRLVPVVARTAWPFGLLYLVNDVVAWLVGRSLIADGGYSAKTDFPRVELRESIFALLTTLTAYLVLRSVRSRDRVAAAR